MIGNQKTIFLDNHATTPVDPRVVDSMLPYFTTHFGNPSGLETSSGRRAAEAVSEARAQVAALLNVEPAEIVFTSGATEANNLAIIGTVAALRDRTARKQIVTTPIEHRAILQICRASLLKDFEIVLLPVATTGRVNLDLAREYINERTLLVSVQAANNEIGTIQPLKALLDYTHSQGAIFHSDATQAIGKISLDVRRLGLDLLSLSAHKFYGPKGVGALFIRNGPRSFPIYSQIYGGGQEQGLRSGTINVPGVVGLGKAAEIARAELAEEAERIASIRDQFEESILQRVPNATRNGDLNHRLPSNSSITFEGVDAHALIVRTPGIEFSTGSACTAGAFEPSHVLQAIGLSRQEGYSTVRIGFGRMNTMDDALSAASLIARSVEELREKY